MVEEEAKPIEKKTTRISFISQVDRCTFDDEYKEEFLNQNDSLFDLVPHEELSKALEVVCSKNIKELAGFLLKKGAEADFEDSEGQSLLFQASTAGHLEIAKMLVEHGADVNFKHKTSGSTPLIAACENGNKEIVELLIQRDADLNAKDKMGWSALSKTSFNGYKDICELLIEKGADVNTRDHEGYAPLHRACEIGHKTIVEYLIHKGADINSVDSRGSSILALACVNGETEIKLR
jgi:ankyrin repeat protein